MIPRQAVLDEIERSRVRPEAVPALTPTQNAAAIAERKAALAALPRNAASRLEALHDKVENGEPLSPHEKAEMVRLEEEMTAASARLLQDRIRTHASNPA
jgi:hypothetical protein